jgi:hypothetical protein
MEIQNVLKYNKYFRNTLHCVSVILFLAVLPALLTEPVVDILFISLPVYGVSFVLINTMISVSFRTKTACSFCKEDDSCYEEDRTENGTVMCTVCDMMI